MDLERALGLWDPAWSNPGIPARLPEHFTRLCLRNLPRPAADPLWYDLVEDPDSRQPWYFPLSAD